MGGYKIGVLYGASMVHHLFSPFHSTFFLGTAATLQKKQKIVYL